MAIHEYFKPLDWIVLFGYLILTTVVGHMLRGKQSSIKDFFLGGRKLPWQAVSGSVIATEISGVTFIGVPAGLFALNGNFTYMIWGIGTIIGRAIVAYKFVPLFYERDIYSPYDYMESRFGAPMKRLATAFFTVGSILGQSVRVLVAALPLMVVTPLPLWACILVIGVFAVGWTLMGGMQTVIWTDVMQFGLFLFGGLFALFWAISHVPGGFSEFWETASAAGKTQTFDYTFGFGAELQFTFWVALIAVPFLNLTAFGVDQLNAQRMFCCKNAKDAQKALLWSCSGQFITLLMLMVGAALWVYYQANPPEGAIAAALAFNENGVPADGDRVFPIWIVTVLPVGLSGLILAGVFAAAISSLDSILAALSQTTLSLFTDPSAERTGEENARLMRNSRLLVIAWGIALTLFTLAMAKLKDDIPLLPLAFGMTTYTAGPLLAFFLASIAGPTRYSYKGLVAGALASFALAALWRMDLWVFFRDNDGLNSLLGMLPTYTLSDAGVLSPTLSYVWLWPLTTALTLGVGYVTKKIA